MDISVEKCQENVKRASDAAFLRGVEEGMSAGKAKNEWRNGIFVGAPFGLLAGMLIQRYLIVLG